VSTLGDFCGSTLGDFVVSALWDRGCEPESCFGCTFLPHTFSVELSGISGFLVWHENEPFDLSICNRIYSVSLPAWSEPRCYSSGMSPTMGPLLWFSTVYVQYRLVLEYRATDDGNQITARLDILIDSIRSHYIEWSIVLPWTDADCCHGIGRNLPMVGAYHIAYANIHLSPGTGDGSICTITS
jgi:hypothetical protein